jgi:hypothetical protein
MGEVWLGYLWGKKIAVKTIVNKVLSDIDLELFHREVQLMRFDHFRMLFAYF